MWRVRVSRRFNVLLGGNNETFSTRTHRASHGKGGLWVCVEFGVNLLFLNKRHCEATYIWETRYERSKTWHE